MAVRPPGEIPKPRIPDSERLIPTRPEGNRGNRASGNVRGWPTRRFALHLFRACVRTVGFANLFIMILPSLGYTSTSGIFYSHKTGKIRIRHIRFTIACHHDGAVENRLFYVLGKVSKKKQSLLTVSFFLRTSLCIPRSDERKEKNSSYDEN